MSKILGKQPPLQDSAPSFAEIRELANKASLNHPAAPQIAGNYPLPGTLEAITATAPSLERHEHYLWAKNVLQTYSAEEEKRLQSEIATLPEQERLQLEFRATHRTLASRFHLSENEAQKLTTGRRGLQFHQRAELSKVLYGAAGIAWLDLGEIFSARIEIDDLSSERADSPHARVSFTDERNHSQRIVETIDILSSVRNNPACVGHPVIAFAIRHWQRVVQARRLFERDDIYTQPPAHHSELAKVLKREFGGERDVEVAKSNLRAIGTALTKGSSMNAHSKELTFFLVVQDLELEKSPLRTAWERLHASHLKKTDEKEATVSAVEVYLKAHRTINSPLPIDKVIDFLNTENAGDKFVGFNENDESQRRSWVVFQHAFLAWYWPELSPSSVQQYLETGKKESENINLNELYKPSLLSPTGNIGNILHKVLTTPLLRADSRIILPESYKANRSRYYTEPDYTNPYSDGTK